MMTNNKVKIVIGSHGSGKSDWIYNRFINMSKKADGKMDLGKKFFLIVPEQDTNEIQRIIMQKSDALNTGGGILNIDVVSFDRIAHNVFDTLGIEPAKENVIDDDVKTMILSLVLSKLAKEDRLKYSSKLVGQVGFVTKLTKAMSEFYAYNVTNEDFDKVIKDSKNDIYNDKLSDLKIIFDEFKKVLNDLHFSIKEDKYDLLNKRILDTDIFNGATVAFDGFTGFTPVQLDIFSKIITVADMTYVVIDLRDIADIKNMSIDDKLDNSDVFYLSKKFVKDVASVAGIKNIDELIFDEGIISSNNKYPADVKSDLLFLENHIYEKDTISCDKNIDNIEYYAADDIRAEVLHTIQRVYKLVREENYRYEDIKIMVPSIDNYRDTIIKYFKKYSIPVFIDDSENAINSPYIESIRSAIDVVNYNFSYDSAMRYFSSGINEKNEDIYELNNFIVAHAFRGFDRYKYGFDQIIKTLADENKKERLTDLKSTYVDPLITLYEDMVLSKIKSIDSYSDAIVKFVTETNLSFKIENFLKLLNSKENPDYSINKIKSIIKLSKEVFENTIKSIKLLSEYCKKNDIEVNDNLSIEEYRRILDIGLSSKSLKSIPFSLDQIVVGDLTRTRFENPKIEFFLGLNASAVPKKNLDNNLIDDTMRELFMRSVKELSQTTIETALNQRFYIYLALTNPTDKLILSYTKKSVDGESDKKSNVLLQLESMYKNLKEKYISTDDFKFYNRDDLVSYVARNINSIKRKHAKDENGKYVYNFDIDTERHILKSKLILNYLNENNLLTADDEALLNAKFYKSDEKLKSVLNDKFIKLKETTYDNSATSIEHFNECPYRYFMSYVLKLNENVSYKVRPYDIGNLAHKVFEKLFKERNNLNCDKDALKEKVDKIIDNAFLEYDVFNEFDKKDRNYFGANKLEYTKIKIRELIHIASDLLVDISKSSGSIVDSVEKNFIYDINGDSDKKLTIGGKIDRIDVKEVDGKVYIDVIDYKSGVREKKFDVKQVEDGTNIQLTLYIDYCLNSKYKDKGIEPIFAGTFYFWVADPFMRSEEYIGDEEFIMAKNRCRGLGGVANSDIDVLNDFYNGIIPEYGARGNTIKKVVLSNGYKLADKYLSRAELDSVISTMHKVINDTDEKMKDGVITAKPASGLMCSRCIYKNVCHKEQLIVEEENDSGEGSDGV